MFVLLSFSLLVLTSLTGGASLLDYTDQSDYSLHNEWLQWRETYNKEYRDLQEHLDRFAVWTANREYIEQHNENAHLKGYTLKMNQFGDLTAKEFVELYQCVQSHHSLNASHLNTLHHTDVFKDYTAVRGNDNLPQEMDWRRMGIVTKVKDQLRCGSSYAFSAMATLEGINALAYGKLNKLSEQNIVDCSVGYGNNGCVCGEVNNAFLYVIDNDGVDTWDGYPSGGDPYRSKQYACAYDPKYKGATARGVVVLPSGSETSLLNAVGNMGPVSVYVDATSSSFQFYAEGVMYVQGCSTTQLSHAMTIIGYGTKSGQDYWLVRNSWGPNWGIWGYGMMARNKGNQCGIATSPSLPAL